MRSRLPTLAHPHRHSLERTQRNAKRGEEEAEAADAARRKAERELAEAREELSSQRSKMTRGTTEHGEELAEAKSAARKARAEPCSLVLPPFHPRRLSRRLTLVVLRTPRAVCL